MPLCPQARHHFLALVVANRPRTTVGLGHVPISLEPQFGLLGDASRLRAAPPGFSMVGGLGSLHIKGQASLRLNGPKAYGVVGLKTMVLAMILSSKPRVWKAGKTGKIMCT